MRQIKNSPLTDLDVIFEERYDDLKDMWRTYNDDGHRFYDIETMVDHLSHEDLLEELDLSQEQLDAVVLGEAPDLNTARRLIEDGDL